MAWHQTGAKPLPKPMMTGYDKSEMNMDIADKLDSNKKCICRTRMCCRIRFGKIRIF